MSIIRPPTSEERTDFENIGFKEMDAMQKFYNELGKKMQEAIKKGLPFAEKPCLDDFNDYWKEQAVINLRKNGELIKGEIKPFKVDWNKYMDVSNFELIEEGELNDQNLTKHNPGLDVKIAFKKWKYKGYNNTYTVMEDAPSAIIRARAKLRELEGKK